MKVKVLFFAQLKDFFGTSEQVMEIENGTTVGELVHSVMKGSSYDRSQPLPFRYAINEHLESEGKELKDQDILAVLPPVSGG